MAFGEVLLFHPSPKVRLVVGDRDKNVVFSPTFTFLNRKTKRGARKIGGMQLGMRDWCTYTVVSYVYIRGKLIHTMTGFPPTLIFRKPASSGKGLRERVRIRDELICLRFGLVLLLEYTSTLEQIDTR